jgi:DNA-binding LacI/PurR family transcriptional regulator
VKTNIKEIAKLTGFSTTTISRYFNHPEKLSPKTKNKIKKIITKYGFVPNELARGLRSQRKNLIAVILEKESSSFLSFPYFSIFSSTLLETLAKDKMYMITTFEESEKKPHMTYRSFVQKNLVDGFIVMGMRDDDKRIKFLLEHNEKFVTIGRNLKSENYTWVDCDNIRGGLLATNHLISLGCKRILLLGGYKDNYDMKMRLQGYREALETHHLSYDEQLVLCGDFTSLVLQHPDQNFSEYDELKRIITEKKIDGVFCTSDISAMGMLKLLKYKGIEIPVVGFDDIPLALISEPTLTTIRQPIAKIAQKAGDKLIEMINGNGVVSEELPVELVIRESTSKFSK